MHVVLPLLLIVSQTSLVQVTRLGTRLDPSGPRPDLACLEELALLARPLRAVDLRRHAGALGPQNPGRASAVLASAWARGFDDAHERWLVAVALAGDARTGQAAVHALGLAGRWRALQEVVGFGLDRGDAMARTGLALDSLPAAPPRTLAIWRPRAAGRPRVGGAFAELAARCTPLETAALIAAVQTGDPWAARAVWRRLVARADDGARAAVRAGLERAGPRGRAAVLAALVSWRPAPGQGPAPGLSRLLIELDGDAEAMQRLSASLADRRRRWALRRLTGASSAPRGEDQPPAHDREQIGRPQGGVRPGSRCPSPPPARPPL